MIYYMSEWYVNNLTIEQHQISYVRGIDINMILMSFFFAEAKTPTRETFVSAAEVPTNYILTITEIIGHENLIRYFDSNII